MPLGAPVPGAAPKLNPKMDEKSCKVLLVDDVVEETVVVWKVYLLRVVVTVVMSEATLLCEIIIPYFAAISEADWRNPLTKVTRISKALLELIVPLDDNPETTVLATAEAYELVFAPDPRFKKAFFSLLDTLEDVLESTIIFEVRVD